MALADWGERFFGYLRAGRCDDPVLAAVVHTVRSFGIDQADIRAFLDLDGHGPHRDVLRQL